ncbi:crossover junction endodeoxyribonuclease RuvC [Quadrisphaera setariae]|uniref:Crossover junction endodeoxyribonuclease RuvC n=1 Tax=Quadrisphaera setariae TaxID=2593304 RepID=A0A5C8ZHN1_9ACTN|nr:crossover junction endodeoxyribonuclease RuvC [Quadrisphaera setariae]
MRVMGVDPGLTRCGWGVVDGLPGRRAKLVAVGVVRTEPELPLAQRLLQVADGLTAVLRECLPDAVAVERVFARNDVSTIMGTAQASGIAMMLAAQHGLPVATHTPSEVKAAVTGNGRADKAQVTLMITKILALAEAPRPADAADGLALAICHLWRGGPTALAAGQDTAYHADPLASVAGSAGAPTAAQTAWARAAAAARAQPKEWKVPAKTR